MSLKVAPHCGLVKIGNGDRDLTAVEFGGLPSTRAARIHQTAAPRVEDSGRA